MKTRLASVLSTFVALVASGAFAQPEPPRAKVVPHRFEEHGRVRVDDYYWMKERSDPEVVAYLEAENAYTAAMMAPVQSLERKLYDEIVARIDPDDGSVPYRVDDYYYYRRYVAGGEYPIFCRKRGSRDGEEQILLDGNELARGHEFFSVQATASPRHGVLAYSIDTVGRRFYHLRFRNLATGDTLPDEIPRVTGNVAWANDDRTIFYTRQHPETLRSYRVYRHVLGTDPFSDELVFEESDETFSTFVYRTKSRKYVVIGSYATLSSEYRFLDADEPGGAFQVFLPRRKDHEHDLDHAGDLFYVRTNDGAKNFRLMATPATDTRRESWQEIVPHREDAFLEGVEVFDEHLVLAERKDGLLRLHVLPTARDSGSVEHYVELDDPAYVAYPAENPSSDTSVVRFEYSSLTTPPSVYDYDMVRREKKLLKRDAVVGDFEPSRYRSERLWARARDGARVPISLVYRKDARGEGPSPLLLYAYGSYGSSVDPGFDASILSLLDRGFVYAIAHVRGGQELGHDWYENGKLLHKKNTFYDFIDCAEFLVAEGYTSKDRLFAAGGSAGGLLMGAIANLRPDLFQGIAAGVPFVDVITTMLDPSIPLTTGEYDEWGDPRDERYYEYMLSYSPYDNVEAKAYPNLLVTTGYHDSQVQYWEPLKWVAKLRARKTDSNRLLLRAYMEAGHSGPSGRYQRHRETALLYAFFLDLAGQGATVER
jgi:oligopeptidase B